MGAPEKYTVPQMEAALRQTRGLLTLAAERLGASYNTVKRYVDRSPTLQAVVEESRERRVDMAELKLDEMIKNGEPWAVQMTLRTLGRSRGYVERQEHEVTGKDGKDLTFTIRIDRANSGEEQLGNG